MRSSSQYLLGVIYHPRALAWLLAAMILVTASVQEGDALRYDLLAGLCIAYPHLLQFLLIRFQASAEGILGSLFIDTFLVGTLIGMVGYSSSASAVLITLLVVSIIMLGGVPIFLAGIPIFTAATYGAHLLFPPTSSLNLDVVSFICLIVYAAFVAWLVFQETRRLKAVHLQEFSLRHHLEQLRNKVMPFIAPQVMRADSGESVRRKRLTVFFSDIEGFTRLMDTVDESEVAEWLNGYFEAMTRIALVYGGTVDKFLGDGMMVFFGDPDSDGPVADACSCISMALDMKDRMRQLSASWQTGESMHIRMGIHTGYCLVGSFGCADRMDYTALGSTVNQASRIEGVANRDEILISEETYRLLRPWVRARSRGLVSLKGLSAPVGIYSVDGLTCRGNGKFLSGSVRLLS